VSSHQNNIFALGEDRRYLEWRRRCSFAAAERIVVVAERTVVAAEHTVVAAERTVAVRLRTVGLLVYSGT
jgi:hypothetical protein